jgi:hypothetical protein
MFISMLYIIEPTNESYRPTVIAIKVATRHFMGYRPGAVILRSDFMSGCDHGVSLEKHVVMITYPCILLKGRLN